MNQTIEPISTTASYFEILGVPVGADEATLTRRFRELAAKYHPDRWAASGDAATQAAALDSTALINDAYRILRDPFTRAEYLLRREVGIGPDDTKASATQPPKELFAQVLELQEALMEYREVQSDDDEEAMVRLRPTLEESRREFQSAYDALKERLTGLFARWDAEEDRTEILAGITEVIGIRGYLRRVLSNLSQTLGG